MIETFRAPHSTYLLFSAAYSEVHEDQTTAPCFNIQKEFYVGCATCTCRQRQDARLRKYRQVQLFQPVSCELALHWFHTCRNLEEYIMIPLLRCHSGSIIQKWALPLNFPFVVRLMPTKTVPSTKCFVQSLATKYGVPATRLFRKLRRRMFHTMRLHLYHSSFFRDDHQWHVLLQLADNSSKSFAMARSIRSAQYSLGQIFALYRLANVLEDPPRSKVRGLLKSAIKLKGAMLPPKAKALIIPVLADKAFSSQVRSWLKSIVIDRKDYLTPFHLPVCSVVSGKCPTMEEKLYSHFNAQVFLALCSRLSMSAATSTTPRSHNYQYRRR